MRLQRIYTLESWGVGYSGRLSGKIGRSGRSLIETMDVASREERWRCRQDIATLAVVRYFTAGSVSGPLFVVAPPTLTCDIR